MDDSSVKLRGLGLPVFSPRERLWREISPAQPEKTQVQKIVSLSVTLFLLSAIIALPFIESSIYEAGTWRWGYTLAVSGSLLLPRFFGLVILINGVLCALFVQFYLAFGMVIIGRKKFGYKLPVMVPSVDMHIEDVLSKGKILSDGDEKLAREKLAAASGFACHQRVHHQALEGFQVFLAMSLIGGIRYPLSTSFHGLCWLFGRYVSLPHQPRSPHSHFITQTNDQHLSSLVPLENLSFGRMAI